MERFNLQTAFLGKFVRGYLSQNIFMIWILLSMIHTYRSGNSDQEYGTKSAQKRNIKVNVRHTLSQYLKKYLLLYKLVK